MGKVTVWICDLCGERCGPCIRTQEHRPEWACFIDKGNWRAATNDEIKWYG